MEMAQKITKKAVNDVEKAYGQIEKLSKVTHNIGQSNRVYRRDLRFNEAFSF